MNKRGRLWIYLGGVLWLLSAWVGNGSYYWWELPMFVAGSGLILLGFARNSVKQGNRS